MIVQDCGWWGCSHNNGGIVVGGGGYCEKGGWGECGLLFEGGFACYPLPQ